MNNIICDFFNNNLDIFLPQQGVINELDRYHTLEIIKELNNIPYKKYIQTLNYISNFDKNIQPKDVIQFSNFDHATIELSRTLILAGNDGYNFQEVGCFLLRNVESKNNKVANTKYGENHLKTGMMLGLVSNVNNKWFLTKLGFVFNDLSTLEQEKLICRLCLKTKLVRTIIYDSMRDDVNIDDYLTTLSDSTKVRRRPNVKKIFRLVKDNNEYQMDYIFDSINGGDFV